MQRLVNTYLCGCTCVCVVRFLCKLVRFYRGCLWKQKPMIHLKMISFSDVTTSCRPRESHGCSVNGFPIQFLAYCGSLENPGSTHCSFLRNFVLSH